MKTWNHHTPLLQRTGNQSVTNDRNVMVKCNRVPVEEHLLAL